MTGQVLSEIKLYVSVKWWWWMMMLVANAGRLALTMKWTARWVVARHTHTWTTSSTGAAVTRPSARLTWLIGCQPPPAGRWSTGAPGGSARSTRTRTSGWLNMDIIRLIVNHRPKGAFASLISSDIISSEPNWTGSDFSLEERNLFSLVQMKWDEMRCCEWYEPS